MNEDIHILIYLIKQFYLCIPIYNITYNMEHMILSAVIINNVFLYLCFTFYIGLYLKPKYCTKMPLQTKQYGTEITLTKRHIVSCVSRSQMNEQTTS